MPLAFSPPRPFEPGTTGWTAADLDDPRIEAAWLQGRYEIVEGVLTKMPPAYFIGGSSTFNLLAAIRTYLHSRGTPVLISIEVDIIIDESRVVVADAVMLSPEDKKRQEAAAEWRGPHRSESHPHIDPPNACHRIGQPRP